MVYLFPLESKVQFMQLGRDPCTL